MSQIIFREATKDDLETLKALEQQLIAVERPFDPTFKDDPIHYYDLDAMLTSDRVELVVATLENEIIGSGYLRVDDSNHFLKFQQHGYLGFIYIQATHRGKGIGQLILDELTQRAKNRGLTELRLEVFNDNAPAIRAYEKAGFKKLLIEMRMGI